MRIIFDLRRVGLGNQGGSSTLVKSGNTLVDMGHEVYFADSGRNQHTWTKLKVKHIKCKYEKQLPDADVIIATGYKSVGPTLRAPDRCGIKAHYIRGWETWQMPDKKIVNNILGAPTLKLVNSICLYNKLKRYKVDSYIIRPGYDFDDLFPIDIRNTGGDIVLGGLCHLGKHRKTKRTDWVFETARILKNKYRNIKLWMFGSDPDPENNIIDKYFRSPSSIQKNMFYNRVNIWLAPASLEGLHLPPAEAMMTKCPVISTNTEMSGTQDYLIHEMTGLVSDNNINSFIDCVEMLVIDKKSRIQKGKLAFKKVHQIGNRIVNMQKMIDLFKEKNEAL
jgi:glycosyltransferase involved in cell wall biosynthesis